MNALSLELSSQIAVTKTGLQFNNEISFEDWQSLGARLSQIEGGVHWWIGDWLNYGEAKYGEMYAQAMSSTGFALQTLTNDKSVAKKIQFSLRRENLGWSQHKEIAFTKGLASSEIAKLLAQAEAEGLTVEELKKAVRDYQRAKRLSALAEPPHANGLELDSISVCDVAEIDLPAASVDMIFTDPPYHDEYLHCYARLADLAQRVLKPGAYCMTYAGKMFLPEVLDTLRAAGLEYVWVMSVYHAWSNAKISKHHILENWRSILVFKKTGQSETREWIQDTEWSSRNKEFHEWQQDTESPRKYISAYTLPNQIVLDPFVGGGTTPKVCKELKRHYVCFDVDPDAVKISIERCAP